MVDLEIEWAGATYKSALGFEVLLGSNRGSHCGRRCRDEDSDGETRGVGGVGGWEKREKEGLKKKKKKRKGQASLFIFICLLHGDEN